MRSLKHLALVSASILALTTPLVAGCASAPLTVAPPSACSSLVSPVLRADVGPVEMPSRQATGGEVWTALDGQTGRLDTANDYKRAALQTIELCEQRDAAAVKRLNAPFWQRPFLPPPDS